MRPSLRLEEKFGHLLKLEWIDLVGWWYRCIFAKEKQLDLMAVSVGIERWKEGEEGKLLLVGVAIAVHGFVVVVELR